MNKYIFGIFAIILTFAGKSFAAPLDAYYCFSTQDPQAVVAKFDSYLTCLLYTSPSPRDRTRSRMPSSA